MASAAAILWTDDSETRRVPTIRHRYIFLANVRLIVNIVAAIPPTEGRTRCKSAAKTA